ncbi:unnamed protein product [Allacma fusca]|uniref:Uncharacterized protein n=1 Tax=Allacma fusca TaxID=39272 RepID=A0A8J2L2Y4_9HEXA|nr:unnamed protein product [Allacma fusca]
MEGSDDLDFLMGDESLAEEDRSDEIKQALAELDETLQDEDKSVYSLILDENGHVETPSPVNVNGINGRKYDDDHVISFGLPRKFINFENNYPTPSALKRAAIQGHAFGPASLPPTIRGICFSLIPHCLRRGLVVVVGLGANVTEASGWTHSYKSVSNHTSSTDAKKSFLNVSKTKCSKCRQRSRWFKGVLQIKQALAELDETFQDEDESVHSLVLDENGRVETPSPANVINGRKYDDDDVQVQPSTVSFLHQGHCPRPPAPIDKINNITKQNHEDFEKLYTIIDFRKKYVQPFEQDAEAYAKFKRSLNHQIRLLKTEMNQIKIHNDELEKALLIQNE